MWTILRPSYALAGIVLIVTIAYGSVRRRCAEAVQPGRLRMVDLAAELEQAGVSGNDLDIVRFALGHAFSAWPGLATALILPVAFMISLVKDQVGDGRRDQDAMMGEFMKLSFISMLAANPIAAVVILLELAVIVRLAVIVFARETMVRTVILRTVRRMDLMSVAATSLRPLRVA